MKIKSAKTPAAPKPAQAPSSPPSELRPLAPFLTDRRPSHDEIVTPARILWQEKGCPQGCDDEIWLEAERGLVSASSNQRRLVSQKAYADEAENAHKVEAMLDDIGQSSDNRSATSL